ncbi:peptidylprolyl isomerase [Clostridium estertheticum]|uniref:peptidylprolyl isomerase n=1 Tax=Clostridium estertheticum TaxID=238834 RepID=UPI00398C98A3
MVTIQMEDGSVIKIELYPEIAPNTVRNFVSLVQKGYYNGLIFHRVIPGFMIQGGDTEGTGGGGPGYAIAGEFSSNGFNNALKHERGVISMARSGEPNSAGSQFFIMVNIASQLDGDYAAFGKVTEGMETVDKIVSVETVISEASGKKEKPKKDQKMKKVTVDTFGVKYDAVEKIK